jgi:hypothetical protein
MVAVNELLVAGSDPVGICVSPEYALVSFSPRLSAPRAVPAGASRLRLLNAPASASQPTQLSDACARFVVAAAAGDASDAPTQAVARARASASRASTFSMNSSSYWGPRPNARNRTAGSQRFQYRPTG